MSEFTVSAGSSLYEPSLREALLGDVDNLAASLEVNAQRTLDWWQRQDVGTLTDQQNVVMGIGNQFRQVYYDDMGKPKHLAFVKLAQTIRDNMQIITGDDMILAAKQLVAESDPRQPIPLYIDDSDAQMGINDFDTWSFARNSTELMVKLVQHFAHLRAQPVRLVASEGGVAEHHGRLHFIDDAIYSGGKLALAVSQIERAAPADLQLDLYVAGAHAYGVSTIQSAVSHDFAVRMSLHAQQVLRSLSDTFAGSPDFWCYFLAEALSFVSSTAAQALSRPDLLMQRAEAILSKYPLAITEFRTPDADSLPASIGDGLPGGRRRKKYTSMDILMKRVSRRG